jgi:hypothetical protein
MFSCGSHAQDVFVYIQMFQNLKKNLKCKILLELSISEEHKLGSGTLVVWKWETLKSTGNHI